MGRFWSVTGAEGDAQAGMGSEELMERVEVQLSKGGMRRVREAANYQQGCTRCLPVMSKAMSDPF